MLPKWVKKMGWKKMVLFLTILSTFIFLSISLAIRQFVFGHIDIETIWISVFVPLIMTPLIGYFFFKVLYQLDTVTMQLLELSNTDELTGVPNRRFFDDHLEEELNRAKRNRQAFSALMFDIDDFKKINDEYGHPAGDAILIDYAHLCQSSTRNVDKFARLGGDEFGCILPGINNNEAVAMAERIRNLLAGHEVDYRGQSL